MIGAAKGEGGWRSGPYSGGPPAEGQPQVNSDGLPMRPGKDQCLLYLNNGACPNGVDCIFDHPRLHPKSGGDKAGGKGGSGKGIDETEHQDAPVNQQFGLANEASAKGGGGGQGGGGGDDDDDAGGGGGENAKEEEPEYNDMGLPMRPGMQKCGFYMRSGQCNYGSKCRFDHPAGLAGILNMPGGMGKFPMMVGGALTDSGGMARRPGADQCPFLKRTNTCPFGPECRFDHDPTGGTATADKPVTPAVAVSAKKDSGLGGVRGRRPPRPPFSGGGGGAGMRRQY